jgi:hypothetical protein
VSDLRDWLTLIRDLGFPIFIAAWFLWRIDNFLMNLTTAQARQTEILAHIDRALQILARKQPRVRNKRR